MARLTITIDMDNAAFSDFPGEGSEVARILSKYAAEQDQAYEANDAVLRDVNGNAVGTARRTE